MQNAHRNTTNAILILMFTALIAGATGGSGRAALLAAALPPQTVDDAVRDGTRFMAKLEDRLRSTQDRANKKFKMRTLDPLETVSGFVIPANAEIRGHVTRIDSGGFRGHAKMWLAFDDIKTPRGWLPLVATVASVPERGSIKQGETPEGVIESAGSRGTKEIRNAAIGAGVGAAAGAVTRGGKGAALGAALGGLAGYVLSSGASQELDLAKGTKLELMLDRPLYVTGR
jgi:hypothetical protein